MRPSENDAPRSLLAFGLLVGAAGCAVTSGHSSTGQYIDDATVSTHGKARLTEDTEVGALRIQVETPNGTVQLAGFAASGTQKARAEQITGGVPDVKDVRNNIIVRPPTP